MSARRGPIGPGYLPKGGARAGKAHNDSIGVGSQHRRPAASVSSGAAAVSVAAASEVSPAGGAGVSGGARQRVRLRPVPQSWLLVGTGFALGSVFEAALWATVR